MRAFLLALILAPIFAFAQEPDITIVDPQTIELPPLTPIAVQPAFDVGSEVAFVYDLTANESVYQKNSTEQVPIASITKMMTAYLVLSEKLDMDEVITLSKDDVALAKNFARSRLVPGMRFTRERLLNLALMSSENRAAAALGRTTFPGGIDDFVRGMNEMARVVHMDHTHFVDPIGISPDDTSTAEDLVKLIAAASDDDTIREFSTTKWKQIELPTHNRHGKVVAYHNTNALVGFHDWDILIQKTGTTDAAGHCVAMIVDIQGHKYAVVELNAPNKYERAMDAIKLRHWVEEGTELSRKEVETYSPYKGIMIGHDKLRAQVKTHSKRHHRHRRA